MSLPQSAPDTWYTEDGNDSDVILSSRVRFARNLSGFAFPLTIKSDDAERVQSLLFDAFNHLDKGETYQMVRMSNIESLGKRILAERGVIDADAGNEPWRGVVIRNDGVFSATINIEDHLRLAVFCPGLALANCVEKLSGIDDSIQEHVQYSSLPDFGFLSSGLANLGSGMKASVLAVLPGLCMGDMIERVIREYLEQGFIVRGYYGSGEGNSLGYLYQISNSSACSGDIVSQIAHVEQGAKKLIELERRTRQEIASSRRTTMENLVFRSIAVAKYARFISLIEAVELLQKIRLGINLSLVTGIANKDITALLYRIQTAHIGFLILSGSIIIEEDIQTEEMRIDRLRAMVIQEVLKEADIRERR